MVPAFPNIKYRVKERLIEIYETGMGQINFLADMHEQGRRSMNALSMGYVREMEE